MELWNIIKEAPDYEISSFGRIASNKYKTKRILKQKITKNGYYEIGLQINKKRKFFLVHRIVLSTFCPIKNMDKMEVNHKDENKTNNNINNLEWMTSKENCNYGKRNSKISKKLKVMCVETNIVYESQKQASILTNTCYSSISNCLNGKRNKAGGFHWERID